jgi:hypothetical protein
VDAIFAVLKIAIVFSSLNLIFLLMQECLRDYIEELCMACKMTFVNCPVNPLIMGTFIQLGSTFVSSGHSEE